ncbi:hypothetical protein DE146DRAFT_522044 [Phaeosphaeria sp. MPI-PUGE-AT-0046c]|nr:hypothetical protein DE146DRAFT_522044 [Phaeosphaeria sp. MPI-PUGE-AT-0046c]
MSVSPAPPRSNSPIFQSFPRRLSSATTTLTLPRITEQLPPNCQAKEIFLCSLPIESPQDEAKDEHGNYTFFNSGGSTPGLSPSSTANPSSSGDEQLLQTENIRSCLSIRSLGYEDKYPDSSCDDWNEGWNISTVTADDMEQGRGRLKKLSTPKIPLIKEDEFEYYPTPEKDCDGEEHGKSLKMARRRLVKGTSAGGGLRLEKWMRGILRNVRSRGR